MAIRVQNGLSSFSSPLHSTIRNEEDMNAYLKEKTDSKEVVRASISRGPLEKKSWVVRHLAPRPLLLFIVTKRLHLLIYTTLSADFT